ncbi:ABC transporter ATP-binding protein [Tengunoibacter tsumagoiensis]|uniref:ABC transporter ATP-binding protein n=1 Tax=Tengunoibacter tsumagoiensis TaxID=2014871 RepID=A0A401ZWF4_9CHLR|nr:ABC transporter ATP-binding protein [Tengunoibacter tsumagoiensis]GCE11241.1 ABC transporter ATP-binding protein [Tengunoibacter tsumagoiensis]
MQQELLVNCHNLIKIYKQADLEVVALQGLDLEVARGEMIAIVGASGSGKSTLLNILGGLDEPSAGKSLVAGYDLARLNDEKRTRYRNLMIGHIWQQSGRNLLPDLTAADNINLPQMFNSVSRARYRKRTRELLEIVGLSSMAQKRPEQLSGGEQQRVAIAVALANQPTLLLADEPTGELDSVTSQEIIAFLRQINRAFGTTIILVTHDVAVASVVDRTIAIRDGRTSTETIRRQLPQNQPNNPGSAIIGLPAETHQETIYIDRVGLLQLPAYAMEQVPLRGRTEVCIMDDHLELWPAGLLSDLMGSVAQGSSAVIGLSARTHRETILIDRVGRLQLPKEAIERIPFAGRAEVRVSNYHVDLWPLSIANAGVSLERKEPLHE